MLTDLFWSLLVGQCVRDYDPNVDYFTTKPDVPGITYQKSSFTIDGLGEFHLCGTPKRGNSIEVPLRDARVRDSSLVPFLEVTGALWDVGVEGDAEEIGCVSPAVNGTNGAVLGKGTNELNLVGLAKENEGDDEIAFAETMYNLVGLLFGTPQTSATSIEDILICAIPNSDSASIGILGEPPSYVTDTFPTVAATQAEVIIDFQPPSNTFDEWQDFRSMSPSTSPAVRNKRVFTPDAMLDMRELFTYYSKALPHLLVSDIAAAADTEKYKGYGFTFLRSIANGTPPSTERECLKPVPNQLRSICDLSSTRVKEEGWRIGEVIGIALGGVAAVVLGVLGVVLIKKRKKLRLGKARRGVATAPAPVRGNPLKAP